jgi:hypothetical protein
MKFATKNNYNFFSNEIETIILTYHKLNQTFSPLKPKPEWVSMYTPFVEWRDGGW